ncbi:alpha/beta hydrolase, partial [Leptospira sp. SA-E8]|uniref:alpha/beta hydrolase n=1 Tax=Leptospira sp. SA-E8 TaxID=3422259 RepID=UPI003EB9B1B4
MTTSPRALSALITDPASTLNYRVREPAPAKPASLLVLLHGVGGNETNLAELAAGIPPETLVVLARGRLTLGPGQHAWFRVAFTAAGPQIVASEAEESRLALICFVESLQTAHGIAPER